MVTITDISNGTPPYWEVADTTSNQPPVKVVYADKDDKDRALKQIVKRYEAEGYTDAGWQKGKEGVVYTLTPRKNGTTTPAIEEQRLNDIENWLKSNSTKLDQNIGFVTKKIDRIKIITIIGSIASVVGVVLGIIALCK
jgi:hypothetical protein